MSIKILNPSESFYTQVSFTESILFLTFSKYRHYFSIKEGIVYLLSSKKNLKLGKNNLAYKKHMKTYLILLIIFSSVLIWRGGWGLLDLYALPNNKPLSYALSICAGFLILCYIGKVDVLINC